MQFEVYPLQNPGDHLTYFFKDSGREGTFQMGIQYSPLESVDNVYNLAFGILKKVKENGQLDLDCETETNNGTLSKVIATIGESLNLFWQRYPQADVYIEGYRGEDDKDYRRNLTYHRTLTNHAKELGDVNIYGFIGDEMELMRPYFNMRKDERYDAFLISPTN